MADMDYCELTLTLANTNVHASHLKIAPVGRNDKQLGRAAARPYLK
jgi:hypothetical protein